MPNKKSAKKRPAISSSRVLQNSITMGQVRERTTHVHQDSEVWITGRDVLGFPFRCRIAGVRITMNDNGKRDYVEILV